MRYLSVCSGIEAASVAWHPLGWVPVGFAEIDPFPCAVLAHRWPGVPIHGDFVELIEAPPVEADLLVGGTPCQSFSTAGLRGGLADDRGNLTLQFVRLADAIDDLRRDRGLPGLIGVWENVPGVLTHGDNPFGCFLAAMAGSDAPLVPPRRGRWTDAGVVVGPRRSVAWRTLDAQFFGLAQRRQRVFALFGPRHWPVAEALFPVEPGLRRDTAPRRQAGERLAPTPAARSGTGGGLGTNAEGNGGLMTVAMASGQANAEITTNMAPSLTCLHEAPIVAHAFKASHFTRGKDGAPSEIVPPLSADADKGDQDTLIHAFGARQSDVAQYGDRTGTLDTDGHTSGVLAFTAKDHGADAAVELAPTLRASGVLAFTAKDHGADAAVELAPTLRAGGHAGSHANAGVMPAVAFNITPSNSNRDYNARESDRAQALAAGGNRPSARGGDVIATTSAVRRLTPEECESLQGFSRGYTRIPFRGKAAADCPDGPRYKALGNSFAVPVIRWIGRRIAAVSA